MATNSLSIRLPVKVTPVSSRNEIVGFKDGTLHIKIAAPPVKGRANQELIAFLSRSLGVKKSLVTIVRGQTSRHKVVAISGLSLEEIIKRLS